MLIYKIFKSKNQARTVPQDRGEFKILDFCYVFDTLIFPLEPDLPKLRRDFTVEELQPFDGNGEDGRVLVAVNGTVYDVTKGKRFYGPGKCFLF